MTVNILGNPAPLTELGSPVSPRSVGFGQGAPVGAGLCLEVFNYAVPYTGIPRNNSTSSFYGYWIAFLMTNCQIPGVGQLREGTSVLRETVSLDNGARVVVLNERSFNPKSNDPLELFLAAADTKGKWVLDLPGIARGVAPGVGDPNPGNEYATLAFDNPGILLAPQTLPAPDGGVQIIRKEYIFYEAFKTYVSCGTQFVGVIDWAISVDISVGLVGGRTVTQGVFAPAGVSVAVKGDPNDAAALAEDEELFKRVTKRK